jgi:hypothetical protein
MGQNRRQVAIHLLFHGILHARAIYGAQGQRDSMI